MQWIQLGATLLMMITTTAIGVRLIGVWLRTQRLPELAMGLLVLLGGTISTGFFVVSMAVGGARPDVGGAFVLASICTGDMAALLAFAFAWQVFRPGARWPLAGMLCFAASLLVALMIQTAGGGYRAGTISGMGHGINVLLWTLVYGWICLETAIYLVRLRRRSRLGLADPQLMKRFLYVALATGASTIGAGAPMVTWLSGVGGYESPIAIAIVIPAQCVLAVSLWLAFWPWGQAESTAPEPEGSSA